MNSLPVLANFLNSVPYQLTAVLVLLATPISTLRRALEITAWRTSWYDSCLALGLWWAVCIFAEPITRYLAPVAAVWLVSRQRRPAPAPVTEQALQTTIAELTTLQALLPSLPAIPPTPPIVLLRITASLYVPYLLLTYLVSLRILLALTGSLLLSWRAPWFSLARSTVWRSAWVRWSVYHAYAILSGQPLFPHTITTSLSSSPPNPNPKPGPSLRFLFTLYENQRWWMGLDWTAALLPGERPSWCSAAQHPVSPPNAFTLPEEASVFLPDSQGGRIKRTATWRWEEPEWRVLVHREGAAGPSRVERPLPTAKEEGTTTGSRLMKAAGKLRDSASAGSVNSIGHEDHTDTESVVADDQDESTNEEPDTDADGWVYGDNKWEAPSSKGGMGKYTRYRRWTRVAIVSEFVEIVDDGELGIQRTPPSSTSDAPPTDKPEPTFVSGADGSPLRQRLKSALAKSSRNSLS